MRPSGPAGPLLERLLYLPEETADADRRFTKSLYLFVWVVAVSVELFIGIAGETLGRTGALVLHGGFALVGVLSLGLVRHVFSPVPFAIGFWAAAWASSTTGLVLGLGGAPLVWHFLLPSAILILRGERWGWPALAADLVVALIHGLFFLDRMTLPGGHAGTVLTLIGWEAGSLGLFLLLVAFLRLVHRSLEAFRDEQGRALALLSQTKDSEAHWADQARFLETLMDVIPFPLFHKGVDGRFLSANAAFRVVFDVNKADVTGQRADDFLRSENAKTLAKIELDVLARDSMAVEETVLVHADGQPHDFIVYLMPFVDSDQAIHGSIGVLIDITDRKDREEKLVQLNATKDQLFSIISHDLRGPVGKLKQLLDIYVDDPGIFDKATWDQVFHDMRRSSDSLFQLLENLLSWARSQQGHALLHYETLPLEPLVSEVFSVLKLLASEKKIRLVMDLHLDGPVLTDRHVLSTIIRNLVHNALKFTMPGGQVTVAAGETVDDLWIEVRDTGIGMDSETLAKIFDRKERLTTFGTAKEKGQGIGLGLCRDLAHSLGALVEAESKPGKGSILRLHLPTPEL